MLSAEKIPASIPEMDALNDAREAALTTFLLKIRDHYSGTYPPQFRKCLEDERRILAYRYLTACSWKIDDAMKMVIASMSFREKNNADSRKLFPSLFPLRGFEDEDICRVLQTSCTEDDAPNDYHYHVVAPYYSSGYHYWDKSGHPVLFAFPGRCRVKELLASLKAITPVDQKIKDVFLYYNIHISLLRESVVRYASLKSLEKGGSPIIGSTVVVDMEGLHFGMFDTQMVELVRAVFHMEQKYFPECLHRLFVINSPALVTYAYKLVSSVLDKKTKEKIVFCDRTQTLGVLRKIMDEDKIPKCLGGTCECPGGCVPGVDSECEGAAESDVCSAPKIVFIGARKRHHIELLLSPGEAILWEFQCTKSQGGGTADIFFHVTFVSVGEKSLRDCAQRDGAAGGRPPTAKSLDAAGAHNVQKSGQFTADCDRFVATKRGVLRLEWDNQSSWLQGKHVKFCITRNKGQDACGSPVKSGDEKEEEVVTVGE